MTSSDFNTWWDSIGAPLDQVPKDTIKDLWKKYPDARDAPPAPETVDTASQADYQKQVQAYNDAWTKLEADPAYIAAQNKTKTATQEIIEKGYSPSQALFAAGLGYTAPEMDVKKYNSYEDVYADPAFSQWWDSVGKGASDQVKKFYGGLAAMGIPLTDLQKGVKAKGVVNGEGNPAITLLGKGVNVAVDPATGRVDTSPYEKKDDKRFSAGGALLGALTGGWSQFYNDTHGSGDIGAILKNAFMDTEPSGVVTQAFDQVTGGTGTFNSAADNPYINAIGGAALNLIPGLGTAAGLALSAIGSGATSAAAGSDQTLQNIGAAAGGYGLGNLASNAVGLLGGSASAGGDIGAEALGTDALDAGLEESLMAGGDTGVGITNALPNLDAIGAGTSPSFGSQLSSLLSDVKPYATGIGALETVDQATGGNATSALTDALGLTDSGGSSLGDIADVGNNTDWIPTNQGGTAPDDLNTLMNQYLGTGTDGSGLSGLLSNLGSSGTKLLQTLLGGGTNGTGLNLGNLLSTLGGAYATQQGAQYLKNPPNYQSYTPGTPPAYQGFNYQQAPEYKQAPAFQQYGYQQAPDYQKTEYQPGSPYQSFQYQKPQDYQQYNYQQAPAYQTYDYQNAPDYKTQSWQNAPAYQSATYQDAPDWQKTGLPTDIYNDPYTQAMLNQTRQGVEASAAAKGTLLSGKTMQSIADTTYARNLLPMLQEANAQNIAKNQYNLTNTGQKNQFNLSQSEAQNAYNQQQNLAMNAALFGQNQAMNTYNQNNNAQKNSILAQLAQAQNQYNLSNNQAYNSTMAAQNQAQNAYNLSGNQQMNQLGAANNQAMNAYNQNANQAQNTFNLQQGQAQNQYNLTGNQAYNNAMLQQMLAQNQYGLTNAQNQNQYNLGTNNAYNTTMAGQNQAQNNYNLGLYQGLAQLGAAQNEAQNQFNYNTWMTQGTGQAGAWNNYATLLSNYLNGGNTSGQINNTILQLLQKQLGTQG